jgi:hypothetical protein
VRGPLMRDDNLLKMTMATHSASAANPVLA